MIVHSETSNPPSMPSQFLKTITIAMLILATIMVLALTASIALLFTIGKPTNNNEYQLPTNCSENLLPTNCSDNQLPTISLAEPCDCGCPAISPIITNRIVNGEPAVPNSWPWQLLLVAFTLEGLPYSYCGASLITPQHVLTAAHCVFGFSPRYIGVIPRLHEFNISSYTPTIAYMAERIYVHESYDDYYLNDDVAVIRLRTPVNLDDRLNLICLAPANMSSQPLNEGASLVATGWGAMNSVNRTRPIVLQQVRLQYVPNTHPSCSPLVGVNENARPGQMCAGFPPKAVCFGDSGGPLVRSIDHPNGKTYWQQVGIMSGTVDCGINPDYSDVYARVSYYHPWILDKVRISS
ncbi:unnamed protein product [Adineta steineri]|uniref:Peptidase S1 domain-containing protein n=1 Tax=Adineta steineri TaxID=433720 RepID=A0A815DX14_9BILA|nr:unnamed protein product [Adineta steineri]CAF3578346.1 unnamed protein product [Adineta steineri]